MYRKKTNQNKGKYFYSIAFKYQNVGDMVHVYDYFMNCRLYSDMKFYRVSKIKYFLEIRKYHKDLKDSHEYLIPQVRGEIPPLLGISINLLF